MWRSTNTPGADGGGTNTTLATGGNASDRSVAEATSLSLPVSPMALLRSSPVTHASASASAA